MGWNDKTNPQQITLFDIPHQGATGQINIVTSYGHISMANLRSQCACFMTGSEANHWASQNNQMMQECIWESLTPLVEWRLAQYTAKYTFGNHLCGPLLLKIIAKKANVDSKATTSIFGPT